MSPIVTQASRLRFLRQARRPHHKRSVNSLFHSLCFGRNMMSGRILLRHWAIGQELADRLADRRANSNRNGLAYWHLVVHGVTLMPQAKRNWALRTGDRRT